MNTTIRYCFPDSLKFRYMSFPTYEQALKCIELFKQIEVKAELKVSWQTGLFYNIFVTKGFLSTPFFV